jgi:hypothetical protein
MAGRQVHADPSNVTMSFWTTPDSANLDPKTVRASLSLSLFLSVSLRFFLIFLFRERFLGCLFCPEPVLAIGNGSENARRGREKKTPALHWRQCVSFFGNRRTPSFAETGSVQTINENVIQNEQKALRFHLLSKNKTGRARGVQGALPNN